LLPTFITQLEAEFQLEVRENKVLFFSYKFTDPQVKNDWSNTTTVYLCFDLLLSTGHVSYCLLHHQGRPYVSDGLLYSFSYDVRLLGFILHLYLCLLYLFKMHITAFARI
jgi:hypothetical protein